MIDKVFTMANYNDRSSKYYYDPAVQSNIADMMDEWNKELKEQKPASSPKEDYLTEIRTSCYRLHVSEELYWRLEHPGEKNSPAYLGYKNNKVRWIQIFLFVLLFAGAFIIFFAGLSILPKFKYRDWILLAISALMLFLSCICCFTLPKSTLDHFFFKKVYRLANKIWRRRDVNRYLGRK